MNSEDSYVRPEAKQIMLRFPHIFGPSPWNVDDTMLGWGFTCGLGWYPVLERMFEGMEDVRKEDSLGKLKVIQVKEKFGGLRVYMRGGNSRIRDLIEQAEYECYYTCEACGGPSEGVRNQGGCYTNLCDLCIAKI